MEYHHKDEPGRVSDIITLVKTQKGVNQELSKKVRTRNESNRPDAVAEVNDLL